MPGNDNALRLFHEFREGGQADVTISLLRSHDAEMWLALLAAHLGEGQRVDGQSLITAMNADIRDLLRVYTPTAEPDEDDDAKATSVPDADVLLTRWTKKSWLHRNADPKTGQESYQLTSGALQAVRQMRNLNRRESVATESALSMVMSEIRQIAAESDPDPHARRRAINEQIAELVAQRDALDDGHQPVIDHGKLVDKVVAVAQLFERIPSDITHFGEQVQANTAALLRQGLADDPHEFAESLEQMFDGHDLIAESAQGQAFRAFAMLIAQNDLTTRLTTDIDDVLSRVDGVPDYLRDGLSRFLDTMWRRVQDVESKRRTAARRIGRFVEGGNAIYYRSLRSRITSAQTAALDAFQRVHGGRDIGFAITVGGIEARSIGRLRLSDGAPEAPDAIADSTQEYEIDSHSLIATETIDPDALRAAINTALDQHDGLATLDDVLRDLHEPRTGDIFYLWRLASAHGDVKETATARVWAHTDGGTRAIDMPLIVFHQPIPELSTPHTAGDVFEQQPTLMEGLSDGR